jgi:hypothetical protein
VLAIALAMLASAAAGAAASDVQPAPLLLAAEEQAYQAEEATEQTAQSAEAADAAAHAALDSKAEAEFPGYARKIAKLRELIAKKVARKLELRELPLSSHRRKEYLQPRHEAIEAERHRLNDVLRALRAKMAARHA